MNQPWTQTGWIVTDSVDFVEYEFEKGFNSVPWENTRFVLVNGDKIMLWYDIANIVPVCDALTLK